MIPGVPLEVCLSDLYTVTAPPRSRRIHKTRCHAFNTVFVDVITDADPGRIAVVLPSSLESSPMAGLRSIKREVILAVPPSPRIPGAV